MAIEYITILDGLGAQKKVAADVFNTDEYAQLTKIAFGPDGTATLTEPTVGLPIAGQQVAAANQVTRVNASISAVTLAASNTSRRGLWIYAEATSATLYIKLGTAVTASVYTVALPPGAWFEMPASPIYTGAVTGIWTAVDGAALVTEL